MDDNPPVAPVAPLDRSMLDAANDTLVTAFVDDSLVEWVFPDPTTRVRRLHRLNRVPLEYGLRYGYTRQSDDGRCVAVWIPPEQPMSPWRMVRSGMLAVPMRTGLGPLARFGGAGGVMDKIHKRHMIGPHWELLISGADEAGLPCYLNTNTPANLPFYERLGFTVLEEAKLGKDGPTAWAMRRDATQGTPA
jgi:hypothetical protein